MDYSKLTVITPTLNESRNIAELIQVLLNLYPGVSVIVADDGSNDGTQSIVNQFHKANSRVRLLDRTYAAVHGLTASVMDAILSVDTEFFIVIDADLQHPPELIAEIYSKITDANTIVSGRRNPYQENQGWHRIFMTRISTLIARLYLKSKGLSVGDPMSGFFGCNTKLAKEIVRNNSARFQGEGYKILFDLLKSAPSGIVFNEVGYQFRFRTEGKSKLQPKHALYFLRSLFK